MPTSLSVAALLECRHWHSSAEQITSRNQSSNKLYRTCRIWNPNFTCTFGERRCWDIVDAMWHATRHGLRWVFLLVQVSQKYVFLSEAQELQSLVACITDSYSSLPASSRVCKISGHLWSSNGTCFMSANNIWLSPVAPNAASQATDMMSRSMQLPEVQNSTSCSMLGGSSFLLTSSQVYGTV